MERISADTVLQKKQHWRVFDLFLEITQKVKEPNLIPTSADVFALSAETWKTTLSATDICVDISKTESAVWHV